jgi:hypothetical protein
LEKWLKRRDKEQISQEKIEALVDAKLKALLAEMGKTKAGQTASAEDYSLTPKQTEYALSLVYQLRGEYELAIPPSALTVKDLNRLIAYPKFKNKGILVNLVKKGVLLWI